MREELLNTASQHHLPISFKSNSPLQKVFCSPVSSNQIDSVLREWSFSIMFDCIIVGVGFIGGTAAYHLAERDNKSNMNIPATKGRQVTW